jgi:hypothetical protein
MSGMISAETMAELEARRRLRLFSACVSAPTSWCAIWCVDLRTTDYG